MTRIFISYRRSDTIGHTGRIYERLVTEFGQGSVFMDVDDIPIGVDFAEHIAQEVSKCQVALVIIGKTWATVTDADGSRRLDHPDDFVRIEVESALKRGIPVVPVLLDGVSMPTRSQLPESLHPLARRNGMTVGYNPRFNGDMTKLVRGLNELMSAVEVAPEPLSTAFDIPKSYGARIGKALRSYVMGDTPNRNTVQTSIVGEPKVSSESVQIVKPPRKICEALGNGVTLDMVEIPGGTFLMGSPGDEPGRRDTEGPQHEVMVQTFFMGRYPVTQAQWKAVAALPKIERELESDPSDFKGLDRPVEQVSWFDSVEFCKRLSRHIGREYRLPSEAEWEYACRAGTTTPYSFGQKPKDTMLHCGFLQLGTTDVSCYSANKFGLHDMHGNIWEWCQDRWHNNYKESPIDGGAWLSNGVSDARVARGGSWFSYPRHCRSASRDNPHTWANDIGFRVSFSTVRALK